MRPLGPFDLQARIGRGGMGEVWSGLHRGSGTPVAVKILLGQWADRESFKRAFRDEVRAVAGLRHPRIVAVHDYGQVGPGDSAELVPGAPYLAMELGTGALSSARRRPRRWSELRTVLLEVLEGLAHAHAHEIVHRDLKPGNLLVGDRGVLLTDFGIAQKMREHPEAHGIVGSPRYMSPEQLRGAWRQFGPWTDLYALGCVAWTLTTGHPPFSGTAEHLRNAQLFSQLPRLRPLFPIPDGYREWLGVLCQKAPEDRYACSADAARALRTMSEPSDTGSWSGTLPVKPSTDITWRFDNEHAEPLELHGPGPQPSAPPAIPNEPPPLESPEPRHLPGAGLGLFGLRKIPLVDRDAPRRHLWDALRRAIDGPAQVVVLEGASGCGKSRLCAWLAETAHELGLVTVMKASHTPSPGPSSGLPTMAARHLRVAGLAREDIRRIVGQHLDDAAEVDALANVIAPIPGQSQADEKLGAIRRMMVRAAKDRPVLAVLDDAHWEAQTLRFVHQLLEDHLEAPILVLLTARSEAVAERPEQATSLRLIRGDPHATWLEIGPLPEPARPALVRQLLGLRGDLADRVQTHTAGNPLFAIQLVGDWVERGLLVPGDDGFHLAADAEPALPRGLQELWSWRVAEGLRGDEEARISLELAAVLGEVVDGAEWAACCEAVGVARSFETVERLLELGLAGTDRLGPGYTWWFCHGLFQRAMVQLAADAGRLEGHHRACASALERLPHTPGLPERVGRHHLASGEPDRAVAPLLDGVAELERTGRYRRAGQLLAETEAVISRAAVPAPDPRRGRALHHKATLVAAPPHADRRAAAAMLQHGLSLARRYGWHEEAAWASLTLAQIHQQLSDLDTTEQWLSVAEPFLITDDDRVEWLRTRAAVHLDRGRAAEAAADIREALDILPDASVGRAAVLGMLAEVERNMGHLDEALELASRAADLAERQGYMWRTAVSHNTLGEIHRDRGDPAAAEKHYRRAIRYYSARGDDAALPSGNLALVLIDSDQFGEAETLLRAVVQTFRHSGRKAFEAGFLSALLVCDAAANHWSAWDAHAQRVDKLLDLTGFVHGDVAAVLEKAGDLAAAANHPARADHAWDLSAAQFTALGEDGAVTRIEHKRLG